jgi:hypothetical protein
VHPVKNRIKLCFVTNLMEQFDEEKPDFTERFDFEQFHLHGTGTNCSDRIKLGAPHTRPERCAKRMV